jgi:hypothetical protein
MSVSRMMTHHVNEYDQHITIYGQVMPKSTRWMPGTQGISYSRLWPLCQSCHKTDCQSAYVLLC